MLNRSINVGIVRLSLVAALLALALAAPAVFAQEHEPCKADTNADPVTVSCSYDEKDTDPVANFSGMDPEGEKIVWSLAGPDAEDFDITGGELSFKKSPNFESPTDRQWDANDDDTTLQDEGADDNSYEVMVVATEVRSPGSLDLAQSNEILVTVTVKNVEEDPTLTLDRLQVRAAGETSDGVAIEGSAVAATLNDPDGAAGATLPLESTVIAPTSLQWYIPKVSRPELENDDHWIEATGAGNATASYTPAAGDAGKYLRLVATYTDGAETDSEKAYARSAYPVGAARTTGDNNAPLFPNGTPDSFTVREDAAVGTVVGTVRGSDVDSSDVLSHRLTGDDDDSLFNINIVTGQITVKSALDFETATDRDGATDGKQYRVTVTVYDSLAETPPTQQVDITVTDVNDAPLKATEEAANHEVDENHDLKDDPDTTDVETATVLGTFELTDASDPDEGDNIAALTLSLGGVDGGLFSLTDTDNLGGTEDNNEYELGFRESPNYESPADADGNNKYHVTVITADNEGATSELPLVITVMNVNEDGKVTLSTTQPAVGQPITATLTDPDMKIVEVEWQWERSELPTTGFIDIRGATSDTYTPLMTVEDDPVTSENEGVDGDEGKYLRVTVTYADNASDDEDDPDATPAKVRTRTIEKPSENAVREAPDVNQAPVFESGITREVPEDAGDGGKVGAPVTAADPDEGDDLAYTITGGADMGAFEIGSTSGQITVKKGDVLDYEGGQRTYVVEVTARDPFGLEDSTMVTIMVTDVNEKPELTVPGDPCEQDAGTKVVSCDYDEKGTEPVGIFSAMDPEGEKIVWSLAGDDAADFDITGGELSFSKSPNFESPTDRPDSANAGGGDNVYNVDVIATEVRAPGSLEIAQDATVPVTVTVKNVEEDPTLTLDRLQVRAAGETSDGVAIEGSAVAATLNDPDGAAGATLPLESTVIAPTSLQWYIPKVSRPELENDDHWIEATGAGNATASYTPAAGDAGKYLRLVATYTDGAETDSEKAYARSAYPVGAARTTGDNNAPLFPNGTPDSFTVREDAAVGTVVGTVRGSDVDSSDVLSHRLTGDDDDSLFNINIVTGQITVKSALDFETATDRDGATDGKQYRVTVTVYDSLAETPPTQQVDITVTDVNDAPLKATEEAANHEVDENHDLKDDPDTTDVETATVLGTFELTDASDPDEGDNIAALTLSLGGVDGGLFSLTDTDNLGGTEDNNEYELGFRESPNYESPADADGNNKYHVTVITADNEGATSELPLVITVMNVNEDGKVTLSTTQPAVGQPITATLTDPDMKIVEVEWQWERSELPTTGFIDIRGATSDTYTPLMTVEDDPVTSENEGVDGDEGKYLRVTVTYADNASDDEDDPDATPAKVRTRTIEKPSENAVREAPDVNQAPVFESGITREVPEDAGDGGKVGAPVTAADPDEGDDLAYTITGGADMGAFEIGSTSGQITVKKGDVLDYEGGQRTYVVEVTARDPFGLEDSTMVTIMVTDVNEKPELMLVTPDTPEPENNAPVFADDATTRSVAENTAAGEAIGGPVAATDADDDTLTYTLGGADMASFTIDANGQIMTSAALDYETKASYSVEVTADDRNGGTDSIMVTIAVTNVGLDNAYDMDDDGAISRDEVLAAIGDFLFPVDPANPTLTRDDVLVLIGVHLFGS